jgi:hypothetical protein
MRTSFHHQPEAQHPKSPAIYTPAGRLPHLLQFADPAPAPGLPVTWDDIDVGHLVIARYELAAGWWEAIVVVRDGDMLTVKWRDYPKQAPAVLHRAALALLRPTAA